MPLAYHELAPFFSVLGLSSLAGVIVVTVAWTVNYPLAKRNIHVSIRQFFLNV